MVALILQLKTRQNNKKNFFFILCAPSKTREGCGQQSESMCKAQSMKGVSGFSYPKADSSVFPCSYPGNAQCCWDCAEKHAVIYADHRDSSCCHDHVKYIMQKPEWEAGVTQLLTGGRTTDVCLLASCVCASFSVCVCLCVCRVCDSVCWLCVSAVYLRCTRVYLCSINIRLVHHVSTYGI